MGAYYVFVNRTKKVLLEPNDVVSGVAKRFQVVNSEEVTSLLAWAMSGPWLGDSIACIADDLSETAAEYYATDHWPNVTKELMAQRAGR